MRYLLSIWIDENQMTGRSPEQAEESMARYDAYTRELREAGVFAGGEGLVPTSSARTLRLRDDDRQVTDGPFAETKEQLGGFYLLDCDGLDEALSWAAKVPAAAHGSIEVRPVMEYERQTTGAEARS
jgi:hypothetical protein